MSNTEQTTGLKAQLEADMVTAIKARDELRKSTLRMVLAAISKAEVSGSSARTLSDDEVASVLTAEAKSRRDAAVFYTDQGHPQRAEREAAEAAVLAEYLPEQLSAEQIAALVSESVSALGADGPRDIGKVMAAVGPLTKDRADGAVVAAEVKRQLSARPVGQ